MVSQARTPGPWASDGAAHASATTTARTRQIGIRRCVGIRPSYARRAAIHATAEAAKASGGGRYRAYTGSTTDSREGAAVQEMVIYGVSFDMVGKQPIVL
ncbi:MAG: hypothetical protein ACXVVU_20940, partial [Solirubrobacteraceae bacterium]